MCYFVPLVCGWEYFPHRKGLVTGIVISAYGFGAFGFGLIAVDIVNPTHANPTIQVLDQKFYTQDIADNVPHMIRTLVYIWIPLVVIAVALVTRKPKAVQKSDTFAVALDKTNEQDETTQEIKQANEPAYELKHWKYCFYSVPFWQLFGILVLANYFGTFFSYSFKAYGSDGVSHQQISEKMLTWAASIGSGFVNGATRFSFGALVDKSSFKKIFTVVMII